MNGVSIFVHAVRMALNNLGPALRIGVVPLLILAVAGWIFAANVVPSHPGAMPQMPGAGAFGSGLLLIVVQILVSIWIAVAWHRFILLEEQPGAFLPVWNGGAIWAYFKVALIVGLLLFLLSIVISLVAGLLVLPIIAVGGQPGLLAGAVLFLVIGLPLAWIGLRLGPALAGAAIGDPLTLGDSWAATGRGAVDLLVLAVVSVLALWLVTLPLIWLQFVAPAVATLLSAVINFASVMIGVGIITTIYGHYVQGRPLNA